LAAEQNLGYRNNDIVDTYTEGVFGICGWIVEHHSGSLNEQQPRHPSVEDACEFTFGTN
jgi:hypothetical protein